MSIRMQANTMMNLLVTSILMRGRGGQDSRFWFILLSLAAGAVMLVGTCWEIIARLVKRFHGRNWPTVPALIDIVSVAFVEDDTPHSPASNLSYYLATLTYIYQNPEKQMGDYSRRFGIKEDAEAWANSYKGETVKIHVDPRDPTRSVLLEEDL